MDILRGSSAASRHSLCVDNAIAAYADWGEKGCWVPPRFATFHALRLALAQTQHRVAPQTGVRADVSRLSRYRCQRVACRSGFLAVYVMAESYVSF